MLVLWVINIFFNLIFLFLGRIINQARSKIVHLGNFAEYKNTLREVRLPRSLGNKGKILFPLLMVFIIFNSLVAEGKDEMLEGLEMIH